MVRPLVLYRQLSKWLASPKQKEGWYNNLLFADGKVVATDTFRLVVIKDYPTGEPHFENADGEIVENPVVPALHKSLDSYIRKEILSGVNRTIPDDCQYTATIGAHWLPQLRNALDFIKKSSKKYNGSGFPECCMLNFHDGRLYVLGAGDYYGAKFLVADKLTPSSPWYCCFKAGYLIDLVDLLVDTKANSFKFSMRFSRMPDSSATINRSESERWTSMWKVETDELVAVSTSLRLTSDSAPFLEFCRSEAVMPASGAYWKENE